MDQDALLPVLPIPAEAEVGHLPPTVQRAIAALYEGVPRKKAANDQGLSTSQLASLLANNPKLRESIDGQNASLKLIAETAALGRITAELTENPQLSARDMTDMYRVLKPEQSSGGSVVFNFPVRWVKADS